MFSDSLIQPSSPLPLPERGYFGLRDQNGHDIVKKGFVRRKRYLVSFCMKVQALTGGMMIVFDKYRWLTEDELLPEAVSAALDTAVLPEALGSQAPGEDAIASPPVSQRRTSRRRLSMGVTPEGSPSPSVQPSQGSVRRTQPARNSRKRRRASGAL
ncbi:hypothetical protein QBZ16_001613 [Prototheca wickerhamii]|uniref:Uncharacterized protein n=1 Tax=Prototheca wickerhamii TaxID=3111 RepID=A0AAD9MLT2_PROWI|nr:hypothetical protein QBZ16_001613 [Prototheca wickerhamii]